jgi:hypothetical protein
MRWELIGQGASGQHRVRGGHLHLLGLDEQAVHGVRLVLHRRWRLPLGVRLPCGRVLEAALARPLLRAVPSVLCCCSHRADASGRGAGARVTCAAVKPGRIQRWVVKSHHSAVPHQHKTLIHLWVPCVAAKHITPHPWLCWISHPDLASPAARDGFPMHAGKQIVCIETAPVALGLFRCSGRLVCALFFAILLFSCYVGAKACVFSVNASGLGWKRVWIASTRLCQCGCTCLVPKPAGESQCFCSKHCACAVVTIHLLRRHQGLSR